jgi:hypothetical protein
MVQNLEPRQLPCTECRTLTRIELLSDASEMAPFAGMVCPHCHDSLVAELHELAEPSECRCETCRRVARRFTPAGAGGFAPGLMPLVFPHGVDK